MLTTIVIFSVPWTWNASFIWVFFNFLQQCYSFVCMSCISLFKVVPNCFSTSADTVNGIIFVGLFIAFMEACSWFLCIDFLFWWECLVTSWTEVVRVNIITLFLHLGAFSFSSLCLPVDFFIDAFYQVEEVPFYSKFGESFVCFC